ncbi:MFS transporter [Bacillaceae bacterium S4-13-56]
MRELLAKIDALLHPPAISLSPTTKIFLLIVCFNGIANSLSSVFINIYLYKLSQNFYDVALFNFVSYLIWMPSFIFAGWLSKKVDRKKGLVIGGCLQLIFYLVLILLGDNSSNWIIVLGIIYGIGSGFYWLSVNVLSVDLTNQLNRDWFNGVNGIFNALSQMIGPVSAGWIITMNPGFTGYRLIFILTFLFFLVSVVLTFFLPKQIEKGSFNWRALWNVHKNKEWRILSYVYSSLAFRDGVLSFAIWIWVYMMSGSEGVVGNYVFMTTTISVFIFYFIGRFISQKNRSSYIKIGTIGISLAVLGLVFDVNYWTLLIYGVTAGVCIPLFEVPFNTLSLNSISKFDSNGRQRIEMVVSRELALSAGRIPSVGGLTIIYTIDQNQSIWVALFMVLVITIGLMSLYFLCQHQLTMDNDKSLLFSEYL